MSNSIKDMITTRSNIVYMVADPSVERTVLLDKIRDAVEGGVDILQIWNHWPDEMNRGGKQQLIESILETTSPHDVPVLINEEWEWLKHTALDGVHFDSVPEDMERIRREAGREILAGITCGNDLDIVDWAEDHGMDYISFCAMFPSPSVGRCEIVRPETVRRARQRTSLPIFLSGGVTPEKLSGPLAELETDFDGVAVISGILNAAEPGRRASAYKQALNRKANPESSG